MPESTVLIIDDDHSLRRVMEYSLGEAGYRVLSAEEGKRGLELFFEESPDLVLTDIRMPGLSGFDVLKTIKEERPEVQVIVVTALGTVEKAVEGMKLGAFDYLTKPFSKDVLKMVAAKALSFGGLQRENARLKHELMEQADLSHIIGNSDAMQEVFRMIRRVAGTQATVLIQGESGTGKELIARAIHRGSERKDGPFVPINCAAIPSELLESELFGHLRGAFTGAVKDRQGKFDQAHGGTLFLDEVGELPLDLQPKLLRALQEQEIQPVGGKTHKVDVRVVAATNQDLESSAEEGRFRPDLYYRLAVIPIRAPALRERREDIPLLVKHFLEKHSAEKNLRVEKEALERLISYNWPGNVRELENVVERMLILRRGEGITLEDLPPKILGGSFRLTDGVLYLPDEGYSLEELEKQAILEALHRNGWNQTRAAAFLKIPRHILIYRMEKFKITRH